jgi:predicted nucleic-acid-binding protein
MESDGVFIPKTVMLETEWVLRQAYGIAKDVIMRGFQKLLGLPSVSVEDPHALAPAISWCGSGFDFPDALHLTSTKKADRFVTFDNALAKTAQQVSSIPVLRPYPSGRPLGFI